MNIGGNVDMDDIIPFALGLKDPDAYEGLYGAPANSNGNTDGDADLDFDDIQGLVNLLQTGIANADRATFIGVKLPKKNRSAFPATTKMTSLPSDPLPMSPELDETSHESRSTKTQGLSRP